MCRQIMRYCDDVFLVEACLPQVFRRLRAERGGGGALGYLWPSSRSGGTKFSSRDCLSVTGLTPSS